MDVSGQSMLPMAALAALVVPGGVFKMLSIGVLVVFAAALLVRSCFRGERSRAWVGLPPRVHREVGYQGRRRGR